MRAKLTLLSLGSEDALLLCSSPNLFNFFLGVADLDIAFFKNTAVWDLARLGVDTVGESNSGKPEETGDTGDSLAFPLYFLLGITIS